MVVIISRRRKEVINVMIVGHERYQAVGGCAAARLKAVGEQASRIGYWSSAYLGRSYRH
jgi:hypothetical protein